MTFLSDPLPFTYITSAYMSLLSICTSKWRNEIWSMARDNGRNELSAFTQDIHSSPDAKFSWERDPCHLIYVGPMGRGMMCTHFGRNKPLFSTCWLPKMAHSWANTFRGFHVVVWKIQSLNRVWIMWKHLVINITFLATLHSLAASNVSFWLKSFAWEFYRTPQRALNGGETGIYWREKVFCKLNSIKTSYAEKLFYSMFIRCTRSSETS